MTELEKAETQLAALREMRDRVETRFKEVSAKGRGVGFAVAVRGNKAQRVVYLKPGGYWSCLRG
jgi:hypothetical protein